MYEHGDSTHLGFDYFNMMGLATDQQVCLVTMMNEGPQFRLLGSPTSDTFMVVVHDNNIHYQVLGSSERFASGRPITTSFRVSSAMSTNRLSEIVTNKVAQVLEMGVLPTCDFSKELSLHAGSSASDDIALSVHKTKEAEAGPKSVHTAPASEGQAAQKSGLPAGSSGIGAGGMGSSGIGAGGIGAGGIGSGGKGHKGSTLPNSSLGSLQGPMVAGAAAPQGGSAPQAPKPSADPAAHKKTPRPSAAQQAKDASHRTLIVIGNKNMTADVLRQMCRVRRIPTNFVSYTPPHEKVKEGTLLFANRNALLEFCDAFDRALASHPSLDLLFCIYFSVPSEKINKWAKTLHYRSSSEVDVREAIYETGLLPSYLNMELTATAPGQGFVKTTTAAHAHRMRFRAFVNRKEGAHMELDSRESRVWMNQLSFHQQECDLAGHPFFGMSAELAVSRGPDIQPMFNQEQEQDEPQLVEQQQQDQQQPQQMQQHLYMFSLSILADLPHNSPKHLGRRLG